MGVFKPKNGNYIDSSGIYHNDTNLKEYLGNLNKIYEITVPKKEGDLAPSGWRSVCSHAGTVYLEKGDYLYFGEVSINTGVNGYATMAVQLNGYERMRQSLPLAAGLHTSAQANKVVSVSQAGNYTLDIVVYANQSFRVSFDIGFQLIKLN